MPRYDDRYHGTTRLYVGRLSSRTRSRDLVYLFSKYGTVRDVDMKHDFAFVDFSDHRDADDARYSLNGRDLNGSRLLVEFAKGTPRGPGGSREYLGRGPPPGSGRCFNCGLDGHWARDCKAGDWKNKCYRCGERGHIERNCQNSPKKLKRGRSYSRSPIRSRSPRRRRKRSPSYSRSPRSKMPRYDDRYHGTTRLYVGRLSSRTRSRDLVYLFSKYGTVRDVDMKHDFAFVDFSDHRDADDARYSLNGRDLNGSRLLVEFAKGTPRGPGGSREYLGRGPPPGSGRCFNCGLDGHWARDCKAGDWKNKCYRCGERGHIERNCQNSPKKLKRGRSYSRSPIRSRSPRRRRKRSPSYSRSPRRSRSPPKKERERKQSPRYSRSPSRSPEPHDSPSPSKGRNRSPTPTEDKVSPTPKRVNSEYSMSPQRAKSQSLAYSPVVANGRSRSPSPVYEQSLVDHDGPAVEDSPVEHDRPAAQGSPVDEEGPVVEGSPTDGD